MRNIITILFVTALMIGCTQKLESQSKSTPTEPVMSGEIVDGLRTITLEDAKAGNLTFYRGDYLVINHNEKDTLVFSVDELELSQKYPAPADGKSYVKLKTVGSFKYRLGKFEGTLNIVEYTKPQYKAVSAAEARELIANLEPLVLDVRTPFEYNKGHLKNAELLPVQEIQKEYSKLNDYKEKPILIYCASGNRSTVAAKVLIDNGFNRIYNMRYGIGEWQRNGYEIVK